MRKFVAFLFVLVFTVPVYCATDCKYFDPGGAVTGREWLKRDSDRYFYCGDHAGDDYGCPNGADVYANGSSGWGIYTCYTNGPNWSYNNPNRWIADCPGDPATERNNHYDYYCTGTDYVYFFDYVSFSAGNSENICKISQTDVARYIANCESSGGLETYCRTTCLCYEDYGKQNKTDYECECIDSDAHLDEINGTKYCVKGNFYACETDADCLGGRTPVKPSHSMAWRCVNQKYEVKVCAATACEDGWHVKTGYGFCEKDEPAQTPSTTAPVENTAADPNGAEISGSTPVQKICPDRNMDSNCECTRVVGTVKRNNQCVCDESNKEIKNGKCEWSEAYLANIKIEIDKYYSKLTEISDSFKVLEWRDAEGKFNTARLASDSIAGVVLGTVGGVVTANLVKKAQVKQGFEDLQCYIGGQPVADYGDSFTVGR